LIGSVEKIEITIDPKGRSARLFILLPKVDVKVPDTMVELFKRAYPVEKLEK